MKVLTLIAATALTLTAGAAVAGDYGHYNGYKTQSAYKSQKTYKAQKSYEAAPTKVSLKIVTDNNDRTLYIFDNDSRGASNCYGGCAADWPPYYAPADATPYGHYSVIQRRDGTYQWAWKGWPLYYWDGDKYPGDRGGDGIGGVWHIVHR